jgi:Tol biopolymer transport system component
VRFTLVAVALAIATACSPSTTPVVPSLPAAAVGAPVTVHAATVPKDHRYVATAEGRIGHLLLVDLEKGTVSEVITAAGELEKPYFTPPFTESADGRRLVVGAVGPAGRAALYAVDVAGGKATLLYEDPAIRTIAPLRGLISPNGDRYAFRDRTSVRIGETAGGATKVLEEDDDPDDASKVWAPLAWSNDQTLLALGQGLGTFEKLKVVRVAGGDPVWTGTGSQVSWRAKTPRLAVAGAVGPVGGHSLLYVVDVEKKQATALEPSGNKRFGSLAWHPTEDRVLYVSAEGPFVEGDVFTRALADRAAVAVTSPRKVWDAWWSADGSRIYASAPRAASGATAPSVGDVDIVELPSGRVVASVCRSNAHGRC